MGFFKKLLRNKIFRTVAPIILGATPLGPVAGAALGGYLGAQDGGGIIGGLTGAAGGYFGGSALSGAIAGAQGLPLAGTIGPTSGGLSGALSGAASGLTGAASSLGLSSGASQILNTVSSASGLLGLGSAAVSPVSQKQTLAKQAVSDPTTVAPFVPKRPDAQARPDSLNELAGFSPEQERSALATQGLNSGLGGVEQSYYRNLLQRSLIGEGGQVGNINSLMPIESSYFSRQGTNTSDIMKFLQGIA